MNPRAVHLALVIGAIAAAAFIAGLVFVTIFAGCAGELPPEPPYVVTHARDASISR